MIAYILQVTLLMGVFYIPFALWFRNETFFHFNRLYLLFSLISAILIPLAPQWLVFQETSQIVFLEPVVISASQLSEITISGVSSQSNLDYVDVVWALYLTVAFILLSGLVRELIGIRRMYSGGVTEVIQGYNVISSDEIPVPFSFANLIFVPGAVREKKEEFQKILDHEMAHVRKLHTFDSILIEVVCALLWINPFVYLYRRSMKTVHEFEADQAIGSQNLIEYTQLLISQSQSGMRLVLTNQFFQSQLKTRIMMMMKERSKSARKWKYLLSLPLLLLAVLLFSFKVPETLTAIHTPVDPIESGIPMGDVDEMPLFPGCAEVDNPQQCSNAKLMTYVGKTLEYPKDAANKGIEGKAVIQFTVNREGRIENIKSLRTVGGGCDEEARRVIEGLNSIGAWTPGQKDGKAVDVEMSLPIVFALPKEKEDVSVQDPKSKSVFKEVEEMPLFPGCNDLEKDAAKACSMKQLISYISENLTYPKSAKDAGIEGKVVVQFIVESNGTISTVKVLRSLDPACDKEVIRLVEAMNALPESWTPGYQEGKAVRVEMVLPVQFKL